MQHRGLHSALLYNSDARTIPLNLLTALIPPFMLSLFWKDLKALWRLAVRRRRQRWSINTELWVSRFAFHSRVIYNMLSDSLRTRCALRRWIFQAPKKWLGRLRGLSLRQHNFALSKAFGPNKLTMKSIIQWPPTPPLLYPWSPGEANVNIVLTAARMCRQHLCGISSTKYPYAYEK